MTAPKTKAPNSDNVVSINLHQFISVVFLFTVCLPFVPKANSSETTLTVAPASAKVLSAQAIGIRGSEAITNAPLPPTKVTEPDLSTVNAKSFMVLDVATKQVLISENSETQYPIASLTKLLTAWVAYKYLDMNSAITISQSDVESTSPSLHLAPGDTVLPVHLIQAMLVGSANDAARTLAHAVEKQTDKSFTYLMNREALELGMLESNFSNPLGFDSNYNYATAQDVLVLIQKTQELPVFTLENRSLSFSFTSSAGRAFRIRATNKLLAQHPDIAAIKTGYTGEARGAMAVTVENNGHPFVILVMQSEAREKDVLAIKEQVSKSFVWE